MYKQVLTLIFLVLSFCLPTTGSAQAFSKKELESAVNIMAKLLSEKYVFAEKGKLIAAYLVQEYKKGKFDQLSSWNDFSSLTTKYLKDFSKDGHLFVKNDPATVKDLQSQSKEDSIQSSKESINRIKRIESNYGFKETKVLDGNIGYIRISGIDINESSVPILLASLQFVANTKALIIDLRNNSGGGSDVGPFLESMFLPKQTDLLELKNRLGESTIEKTMEWLPQQRYTKPLYVLINNNTASAAEYFAFVMQLRNRAEIVGQPSAGGAHMNEFFAVNNDIFLSVSVAAPTIPGTDESWEQKGVKPDYITIVNRELEFVVDLIRKQVAK